MDIQKHNLRCSEKAEALLAFTAFRDPGLVVPVSYRISNDRQQSAIAFAQELSKLNSTEVKQKAKEILRKLGIVTETPDGIAEHSVELNRLRTITRFFKTSSMEPSKDRS